MDEDKNIDESWKNKAEKEKDILNTQPSQDKEESKLFVSESFDKGEDTSSAEETSTEAATKDDACGCGADHGEDHEHKQAFEANFVNYVTSLGFQAMIFLGEIPNPVTNKVDKNIEQSKFLIDTLVMMREKTKGNLEEQEENLINGTIYELQMKYVEVKKADEAAS